MTSSPDTARAWVDIDLDALVANARAVVAACGSRLLPMLKANGYGLGAVPVARALESLDPWGFGIATPDSVSVETMKSEYKRLSSSARLSTDDELRLGELKKALADLPDWSVTPERDVRQTRLLGEIKSALDKLPAAAPAPRRRQARKPSKKRSTRGRKRRR